MRRGFFLTFFLVAIFFQVFTFPVYAHSAITTITITANGFEPDRVTVDENAVVVFVNKDSQPHWPASDPHPTHTDYPELDSLKPILPDESWGFKSKKVGTWRYHDHENPHRGGTLTVTAEKDGSGNVVAAQTSQSQPGFLARVFTQLHNWWAKIWPKKNDSAATMKTENISAEKFRTLSEKEQIVELGKIADEKGIDAAWQFVLQTFDARSIGDFNTVFNPHNLAHYIGSEIYKRKGLGGLSLCTPAFAFGCYHGVMGEAFKSDLSQLSTAEKSCLTLGDERSGPYASCIHGIGHGIATYFNTTHLQPALSACDQLHSAQIYCYDGVFMEFMLSAPQNFYLLAGPLYPCNSVETKYQSACGRSLPDVMGSRFHMSLSDAAKKCVAVPTAQKEMGEQCIDTIGSRIAESAGGEVGLVSQRCAEMPNAASEERCLTAAAVESVFQQFPNWEKKSAQICGTEKTGAQECLRRVQDIKEKYQR